MMLHDFRMDCRRQLGDRKVGLVRQLLLIWEWHGLQALLGYRLGRQLLTWNKKPWFWILLPMGWLLYWLITGYVRLAFDVRLELSANIGPGLYIGHFGDIVVRQCTLGKTCNIAHSVHIGPTAGSAWPVVGDRVWIGGHARILGPYCIESESTIGAGAVIQRDVPRKALLLGNPARLVMQDYDNTVILGAV